MKQKNNITGESSTEYSEALNPNMKQKRQESAEKDTKSRELRKENTTKPTPKSESREIRKRKKPTPTAEIRQRKKTHQKHVMS